MEIAGVVGGVGGGLDATSRIQHFLKEPYRPSSGYWGHWVETPGSRLCNSENEVGAGRFLVRTARSDFWPIRRGLSEFPWWVSFGHPFSARTPHQLPAPASLWRVALQIRWSRALSLCMQAGPPSSSRQRPLGCLQTGSVQPRTLLCPHSGTLDL